MGMTREEAHTPPDDLGRKDALLRRSLDYMKRREGYDLVPELETLLADLRSELGE